MPWSSGILSGIRWATKWSSSHNVSLNLTGGIIDMVSLALLKT